MLKQGSFDDSDRYQTSGDIGGPVFWYIPPPHKLLQKGAELADAVAGLRWIAGRAPHERDPQRPWELGLHDLRGANATGLVAEGIDIRTARSGSATRTRGSRWQEKQKRPGPEQLGLGL